MAIKECLSIFFADWGTTVTLAGKDVVAIFDAAALTARVGPSGMEVTQPAITLQTADVPPAWLRASCVVPGVGSFRAMDHDPDGTGMSVLWLEKVA